jgi:hypothetical protein
MPPSPIPGEARKPADDPHRLPAGTHLGHTPNSRDDNQVKTIGSLGRPSERESPEHALAPEQVASHFQGGSVRTPGSAWTAYEGEAPVGDLWLHAETRPDGLHAFGYGIEVGPELRRRDRGSVQSLSGPGMRRLHPEDHFSGRPSPHPVTAVALLRIGH